MSLRCGKKRRLPVDHEAERSLYRDFASAASAVSQLYTSAVAHQRKATSQGSRQALERVVAHILKDYTGSDVIPKAALLHFLQQEYESIEGADAPIQLPSPFQALVHGGASLDAQDGATGTSKPARAYSIPVVAGASPSRRQCSGSTMDVTEPERAEPHQPATNHFMHADGMAGQHASTQGFAAGFQHQHAAFYPAGFGPFAGLHQQ